MEPSVENIRTSINGYRLDMELKHFPIAFANALRRICLADIPCVVVSNIDILDNTTQMSHEMLKHRMSMLPVNVKPDELNVIQETRIEVRYHKSPEKRSVSTADFMITGPKPNVLLPDRDTGDAIHFLDMKENASLHMKASLSLARPKASSQVCVSTFQNHVIKREKGDTTSKKYQVEVDRELYIENGGDPRVFDAILWQRSFEKNEQGRAYWFDFAVESVGVMTGKEIVRSAIDILKKGIDDFCKTDPQPEDEEGWYTMAYENDTFTIGQLVQEIMYTNSQVGFVSRDVGHPLVPKLTIRFSTASDPVAVRESFRTEAVALCEKILSSV